MLVVTVPRYPPTAPTGPEVDWWLGGPPDALAWPGAEALRAVRQAAGLSQQMLADRAGLVPNTLSDLETGRRSNPHYQTLAILANMLRVRLAVLLAGDLGLTEPPPSLPYAPLWAEHAAFNYWRAAQGLTIRALHRRSGVDLRLLHTMEEGPTALSYSALVRVAQGLQIPLLALTPDAAALGLATPPAAPPPTAIPLWWTVAEAAAETGLQADHLYQLIRRGQIPATWEGKTRMVDAAAVTAWLATHRHDGRGRKRQGT